MSLIASSAGCFSGPDFCLIFAPCGYDDPETIADVDLVPVEGLEPPTTGRPGWRGRMATFMRLAP
jgi:hypothetical protein